MIDSRAKLEKLRAMMKEDDDRKAGGGRPSSSGGDNAAYPFWDIPENTSATVRFLPDADDDNPWFWVERQTIKLPFEGIVGGDYPTTNTVTLTVPCVEMFGDVCPIIAHTKPWWRDVNGQENPMKETARKFYKKRSYITSGFVVSSPFEEASAPENPIRRFILGSSLLAKIKTGLADPDMENHPTDYMNGCDFRIRKTKKQDYNNYDTSEWARRSRALTEQEHMAIAQHGLYNLKTFLGARPDADGIAMIKAMFHASLNGEPFDYDSFGAHYRPYGGGSARTNDGDALPMTTKPTKAVHVEPETVTVQAAEIRPEVKAPTADVGGEQLDLIASLRARKANRS